ncbi:MAG: HAD family hydrolase [Planctomycetes bacterium]|nr:HAD family hydrolase [Planctomycetota bacterium]
MEHRLQDKSSYPGSQQPGFYKALALDLDGTLLNADGKLDGHVIHAIKDLRRNVQVFLASGRMLPSVEPIWRELGLDTPIICYNGAKIAKPGEEPLFHSTLERNLANDVIEWAISSGIHINIYSGDKLYIYSESESSVWYSKQFSVPVNHITPQEYQQLCAPTKLLVIVNEDELAGTFSEMQDRFGHGAFLTTSSRRFVEVLPQGVDKGAAIMTLCGITGIAPERWVAAGDGMNDLEMLTGAGLGLAIESGNTELRNHAKWVIPHLGKGGIDLLARHAFTQA